MTLQKDKRRWDKFPVKGNCKSLSNWWTRGRVDCETEYGSGLQHHVAVMWAMWAETDGRYCDEEDYSYITWSKNNTALKTYIVGCFTI